MLPACCNGFFEMRPSAVWQTTVNAGATFWGRAPDFAQSATVLDLTGSVLLFETW